MEKKETSHLENQYQEKICQQYHSQQIEELSANLQTQAKTYMQEQQQAVEKALKYSQMSKSKIFQEMGLPDRALQAKQQYEFWIKKYSDYGKKMRETYLSIDRLNDNFLNRFKFKQKRIKEKKNYIQMMMQQHGLSDKQE